VVFSVIPMLLIPTRRHGVVIVVHCVVLVSMNSSVVHAGGHIGCGYVIYAMDAVYVTRAVLVLQLIK
jgi:hypothetical protein